MLAAFLVPKDGDISRATALRFLPVLALGGFAGPSHAEKGVTTAWKTTPAGDEDEIHTGGVEWEDVKVGTGSTPQIGDQIGIQYQIKAFVREREITVEDTKGKARDFRFGTGQMLPGMDEGIRGMKTGGVRKMRIPGNLAFGEKGLPSAPGRAALPPYSPVEATVTLDFIPGSDAVYDYGESDV
ncbi:FKBP16-3 [Symbiodinium natans]|uniref:peptidylprolyl isomerase n=1 Tax=Symbiodinium natans TaxID=878477 RepID=A0A812MXI6_9DINO|nr:FKBP16-3 [Symbiodinium natans]